MAHLSAGLSGSVFIKNADARYWILDTRFDEMQKFKMQECSNAVILNLQADDPLLARVSERVRSFNLSNNAQRRRLT